jgi:hypothetical protein
MLNHVKSRDGRIGSEPFRGGKIDIKINYLLINLLGFLFYSCKNCDIVHEDWLVKYFIFHESKIQRYRHPMPS